MDERGSRDEPLLRQAFEAAFVVALRRLTEKPPRDLPVPLRPFAQFSRLPPAARAVVRRTLDTDEELRNEVLESNLGAELGAPARLWLARAPGWEEEFAQRVAIVDEPVGEPEPDRRAARRIAGAERAAARAAEQISGLRVERTRLKAEGDDARRRLRDLERERDDLLARLATAQEERARAVGELKQTEERLVRRTEEHRRVAAELEQIKWSGGPPDPALDRDTLRVEVARLGTLLGDAQRTLATMADRLSPEPTATALATRRQPPALPGGLMDETLEAAEFLFATAGVLVLVDGYNVAKLGWPALDLAGQRDALTTRLRALDAATEAEIWVVFDGAGFEAARVPSRAGSLQIRFSPADVQADDVILGYLDDLPVERRIVVVTNDRRVRAGSRLRGARVITSDHLLAFARR